MSVYYALATILGSRDIVGNKRQSLKTHSDLGATHSRKRTGQAQRKVTKRNVHEFRERTERVGVRFHKTSQAMSGLGCYYQ